jgi:flagellar basal body-associated protein FliL
MKDGEDDMQVTEDDKEEMDRFLIVILIVIGVLCILFIVGLFAAAGNGGAFNQF